MSLELLRIARSIRAYFVTHSVSEAVLLADRVVVLSARPGRIADIVPIDLPRPRSFDFVEVPEFLASARRIRDHIFGQRRMAAHA